MSENSNDVIVIRPGLQSVAMVTCVESLSVPNVMGVPFSNNSESSAELQKKITTIS
ncbi:hypothetical protein PAMP_009546 [Pampus punctatissimus]